MVQLSFLSQDEKGDRVTSIPHVPCCYAAGLSSSFKDTSSPTGGPIVVTANRNLGENNLKYHRRFFSPSLRSQGQITKLERVNHINFKTQHLFSSDLTRYKGKILFFPKWRNKSIETIKKTRSILTKNVFFP